MQYSTNSTNMAIGNAYAVCVAETLEEAEQLYEFMEFMKKKHVSRETSKDWMVLDSNGEREYFATGEEAKDRAYEMCEFAEENLYSVDVYHNDKFVNEYQCVEEVTYSIRRF